MMIKKLLDVKKLNVYLDSEHIVKNVSFEIFSGETVALVGESGSGKSVTAYSLLNLFSKNQNKIITGHAYFDSIDLLALSEYEMRPFRGKQIGMIFQHALSALNPLMKVGLQIQEGLQYHTQLTNKQAKESVIELLHYVGISNPEERYNDYPHMLSGGMRQRVMIAIALACNPIVLIADEPTTALDVTIQAQIMQLLQKIKNDTGMGILLITHDLGLVAGFADRIYVMKEGSIVESGTTDKIFYYTEHSYTKMLLEQKTRWLQYV